MDKKTITVPEAGRLLGIGRSAAYLAARTKQIPTIRLGRRLLVPVAQFERLLDPLYARENHKPEHLRIDCSKA